MDPESDQHQGSSLIFFVGSHPKVKSGIVDCLYHKAEWICKQDSTLEDERKHVQNVLIVNVRPGSGSHMTRSAMSGGPNPQGRHIQEE